MSEIFTILLVGPTCSGKSSIINSIVGGFVANTSMLEETFSLIGYNLEQGASEKNILQVSRDLEEIHRSNESKRSELYKITRQDLETVVPCPHILPSRGANGKMRIVDFPGINDDEIAVDSFYSALNKNICSANLVVYVTNAERAFTSAEELRNFNKIRKIITEHNNEGNFVDLVILVNKFDRPGDAEKMKIYEDIPRKTSMKAKRIIAYSAHTALINNVFENKLTLFVPQVSNLDKELEKILENTKIDKIDDLLECAKQTGQVKYSDIKFTKAELKGTPFFF